MSSGDALIYKYSLSAQALCSASAALSMQRPFWVLSAFFVHCIEVCFLQGVSQARAEELKFYFDQSLVSAMSAFVGKDIGSANDLIFRTLLSNITVNRFSSTLVSYSNNKNM